MPPSAWRAAQACGFQQNTRRLIRENATSWFLECRFRIQHHVHRFNISTIIEI
jgi:hypothetical protein